MTVSSTRGPAGTDDRGAVEVFKVRTEDGRKLSAAAYCAEAGLEVGMRLDLDAPAPRSSVPAGPRVLETITT